MLTPGDAGWSGSCESQSGSSAFNLPSLTLAAGLLPWGTIHPSGLSYLRIGPEHHHCGFDVIPPYHVESSLLEAHWRTLVDHTQLSGVSERTCSA